MAKEKEKDKNKPDKKGNPKEKDTDAFYMEEYHILRAEILKRMEIRHQLFTFTLVLAGTFLSVGLGIPAGYKILLIYPLIAMFVAGSWMQSDFRIYQIGQYIKNNIEKRFLPAGKGWEHAHEGIKTILLLNSARGVIISSQVMMILLALLVTRLKLDTLDMVLLVVDGVVMLLTFIILRWREKSS
jgi:hypothetical protein